MTREKLSQSALEESKKHKTIILQWSTGAGKSKGSIDIVNNNMSMNPRVLLLVAQSTHKNNWKQQLITWGAKFNPIMVCYASLHKYAGQTFDFVIADEAQHFSNARKKLFDTITIKTNFIVLSATLPKLVREWLSFKYQPRYITLTTSEAIKSNILPDPIIIKIPLQFDSVLSECIVTNKAKKDQHKQIVNMPYSKDNYFKLLSAKKVEGHLICTKKQYYDQMTGFIEYCKQKGRDIIMLRKSTERLKWLAHKKNEVVRKLLSNLSSQRTITFCTDIAQSEALGCNCIHSKNKISDKILDAFNAERINHITACHMLDEGMNLTNCRIGIFANLNASDIIFVQRLGRTLRHAKPIVIIPYFMGTRDEELVNKHLEGYNTNLIKTIYEKDINSKFWEF